MSETSALSWHAPAAALAAILLRLYFWQLPYSESGDTPVCEELAGNSALLALGAQLWSRPRPSILPS